MTLTCADGAIGEGQPAALTTADHGLDGVAEEPACRSGVAKFTRALKVFPGDLEGTSNRESETVMVGKRIQTTRVPSHLRLVMS